MGKERGGRLTEAHTHINKGMQPSVVLESVRGREMACNGYVRTSSHVLPACGLMGDVGASGVGCGDPKGAGVLTTRTRYSRKIHRHIPSILHCADSASSYVPVGIADFSSLPILANSCQTSKFYQAPGVLGTLLSNIA